MFSVCCGSSCSFQSSAFSACCGFGCSFLSSSSAFPHAAAPADPFAFAGAPAVLLDVGSPDAVPRGPVTAIPAFVLVSYRTDFCRML